MVSISSARIPTPYTRLYSLMMKVIASVCGTCIHTHTVLANKKFKNKKLLTDTIYP